MYITNNSGLRTPPSLTPIVVLNASDPSFKNLITFAVDGAYSLPQTVSSSKTFHTFSFKPLPMASLYQ